MSSWVEGDLLSASRIVDNNTVKNKLLNVITVHLHTSAYVCVHACGTQKEKKKELAHLGKIKEKRKENPQFN